MKRYILLILFWCILIFSVLAQISDQLIIWLNPNVVSLWDERLFYTMVPVSLNYIVLFLLGKTTFNKLPFRLLLIINTLFLLYYFYCQYIWDIGEWILF